MKILEVTKSSITALGANKVRTVLTMLGVIIGVSAVILLISIGRGIQNYITDQFDALGSNLLFVSPGKVSFGRDPGNSFSRNKLEEKHIKLIETHVADIVEQITPMVNVSETVKYKTKYYNAAVAGINEQGKYLFDYSIDEGTFFTRADVRSQSRVAILGKSVKKELFPNQSPIGQIIKIGGDSYVVIGTAKEKGSDFDEQVVVPYTSAISSFELKNISRIVVKVKADKDMNIATKLIERALLRDLEEDDFTVLSQADILSTIQNILQMLTIGLGAIAGISLLVGGIGIMNIMLVSVTERTREIGLRKALGATPFDVALQFLIESVILSVTGGSIGIIIGWLASFAGRAYIRTEVPWWSVAIAFSFATFVGIIFGTYPAVKASKKDPIEALRYE
ncbi:hypothetical protein CO058_03120 [candidate division WWE3 bacterium CG_4_9_14_0_2_um_filter_35_11]|uniref:Multidrug ABC transporter substrate-binding protein n=1 Tax=candidate division WWE3 bacterium CG_4_9_14_0_2_um_filter_35_11 TaxID=1975077 RepID=A0A2M8EL71_UNCKA|nr:MAG: hypothetical protein COV25_03610 [candidate division WWE3 bacterium CG10_big_fil_rev_8_21_14_0_10_35_32]PJC23479.1 MAG: hypothetical protein CO058_03120 [candidate division WWE3 bacterium CG_4_9_14_0_2_um_filter_35_11]